MKSSVQITRGIESLFGTRDENMRLIENGLGVRTRLLNDCIEIEGEAPGVDRAVALLSDYAALIREGFVFNNGDLNSYLRVVTEDPGSTLRRLVESGKQRSFGKKVIAPKTMTQRRYMEAIDRHDLAFGIKPVDAKSRHLPFQRPLCIPIKPWLLGRRVHNFRCKKIFIRTVSQTRYPNGRVNRGPHDRI